tara:strand:+ start:122 stop:1288 length:1167 start_codon:yes stop_codon:yes gene_type:complete
LKVSKENIKIISVVGARPNFMKISPFIGAINKFNSNSTIKINHILVHTGQHYDDRMSKIFFEQLNIPDADINLGIGSGTHAEQVGNTMIAFEKVLIQENPDWVVVVGDVNATLACTVTAKKLNIKVCHIESGLRSKDESMPEEINRLVTDRLSDLLLVPDVISINNLKKEGVNNNKIKFVGNIMIDTLDEHLDKAKSLKINEIINNNLIIGQVFKTKFSPRLFGIITMHRPSNVDSEKVFTSIVEFFLDDVVSKYTLIWPVHPRTTKQLVKFNLWDKLIRHKRVVLLKPVNYHEMLKLNIESQIMFTDSGGLQEECTVLGTPCLTFRWNTERPMTLYESNGTSILTGNVTKDIKLNFKKIINLNISSSRPKYWDGKTASRCLDEILNY